MEITGFKCMLRAVRTFWLHVTRWDTGLTIYVLFLDIQWANLCFAVNFYIWLVEFTERRCSREPGNLNGLGFTLKSRTSNFSLLHHFMRLNWKFWRSTNLSTKDNTALQLRFRSCDVIGCLKCRRSKFWSYGQSIVRQCKQIQIKWLRLLKYQFWKNVTSEK